MARATVSRTAQRQGQKQERSLSSETSRRPVPSGPHAEILALQGVIGNRLVSQLLRATTGSPAMIQAKLTVDQPGDKYEQEADRVAEQVIQAKSLAKKITPLIQRQTESVGGKEKEGGFLQSKQVNSQTPKVTPKLNVHIQSLKTGGQPLPDTERAFFEHYLGADFSHVRIHTDANAVQANRVLHARAFTESNNIAFNAGEYRPGTTSGRRLIAHELTHIVQQNNRHELIQRQSNEPVEESSFEFALAQGEKEHKVVAVLRPADTQEFLKAFTKKGGELIDAEHRWLFNNMSKFIRDFVLKADKNPFPDLVTLRDVSITAFGNLVSAMTVTKTAKKIGSFILKTTFIGRKAAAILGGFGGLLVLLGSSLLTTAIGALFDNKDEIIQKKVEQVTEAIGNFVNTNIIPSVRESTEAFHDFMDNLTDYVLKGKIEDQGQKVSFSGGKRSDKISINIDTSTPLTEKRIQELILELANTVLAIDETVPKLESDLSLYQELALRAGVFSRNVAEAQPSAKSIPVKGARTVTLIFTSFRITQLLPKGETKFKVPKNGIVAVTSFANYDTDVDVFNLSEQTRPPLVYRIVLRRAKDDKAVSVPRQYNVGKSETGRWFNLEEGTYYLSIEKGGNPNFVLNGKLKIDVKGIGVPFRD